MDAETWVVGQWPPDDPNTPPVEQIVSILHSMTASTGNPYTIHRVKQPAQLNSGYWRTYANAYMQNGKLLVPIYSVPEDAAALAAFQAAAPGYEVVGIDCNVMNGSGGAIHCSTHGIAGQEQIVALQRLLALRNSQPQISVSLPVASRLRQNMPKPFSPETWLPYELATDESVSLRIFTPLGRMVRELKLGYQPAGSYLDKGSAAYWDGRDGSGQQVSSGVHFYQLQAGDFKMTILK